MNSKHESRLHAEALQRAGTNHVLDMADPRGSPDLKVYKGMDFRKSGGAIGIQCFEEERS